MIQIVRNGRWVGVIVVFIFFAAGCGSQNAASVSEDVLDMGEAAAPVQGDSDDAITVDVGEAETGKQNAFDMLWNDLWTLPDVIVQTDKEIIGEGDNLAWLLMAGGGSIALRSSGADDSSANSFSYHRSISQDMDKIIDLLGGPGFHFAATGLWYLSSAGSGDIAGKQRSWTMMKALSVTGATTLGLKLIVNDDTPNGKRLAWPSGHTSSSFTVASVLDELYGPEVGIPAYLGAGVVGWRMMDSGDHWASDVLFGGLLGYIVGHHIASGDKELEIAGFEVLPYTGINDQGRPTTGVSFVKYF